MRFLTPLMAIGLLVPPAQADVLEKACTIHAGIVTIDAHVDIPFDFATEAVNPGTRGNRQVDLPKRESNI